MMGPIGTTAMPAILAGNVKDAWLIRPGKSIGKIYLGEQEAVVLTQCGNTDPRADYEGMTAMGRKWLIWKGKTGHELDVYTARGEGDSATHPEQFVRQVRIESPTFHTPDGIRVGSTLASIHLKLSEAKLRDQNLRLFDSPERGIAFEMRRDSRSNWRCSAIVIHPKGNGVLEEYNPFRAYD